ncbi:MAG: triosephosphate isomerase [Francisellaceae bacterium]|nr:triosephosphate isomerase [Francisellaceae bacterium]
MRKRIVIGNWKMYGNASSIEGLINEIKTGLKTSFADKLEIGICPPFIYIDKVKQLINGTSLLLGAQNVYSELEGAYTGEISASMLQDCGVELVLIGHSERRTLFKEDNELLAKKFMTAYHAGLTPALCLGETLEERESGRTFDVIKAQLDAVLEKAGSVAPFEKALLAYEPIWAIGTGLTASPLQAQEVHAYLRAQISKRDTEISNKLRILYGGSVKASNAHDLFSQPDIDGGLIGGASLKAQEFLSICMPSLEVV